MLKSFILVVGVAVAASLSAQTKVVAFAGSSRVDSLNKKLVLEAVQIARDSGADVTYIDLKDYPIPLYDGDCEIASGMPDNAKQIRKEMVASQVILIATPEYNYSISALLKNVIDWASRTEDGQPSYEAFQGKSFVIMSASPAASGGAKAVAHLGSILQALGGIVSSEQVKIGRAYIMFDEEGKLKDAELRTALQSAVQAVIN